MIQSLFIYSFFALSLNFFANLSYKQDKRALKTKGDRWFLTPPVLMIILTFSLFSGIRWRVGKDHPEYFEAYENMKLGLGFKYLGNTRDNIEYGFRIFTETIASLDLHFSFFFGAIACLQIYFFLKAFRTRKYLFPFLVIVLLLGPSYLTWMNGMRQMIVACMFVYATKFIINRNFLKYLIFVVVASLIHKSAPLLIIFYFFAHLDLFKNSIISFVLVGLSLILGNSPVWMDLFSSFDILLSALGYVRYSESIGEMVKASEIMNFGPRQFVILLPVIILIIYKDRLVPFFKDKLFVVSFNLTLIGYCLHSIFANTSTIFLRPIAYLSIFSVISTSYLLFYFSKTLSEKNIMAYLITLIASLSYTFLSVLADYEKGYADFSTFKFFWDFTN